MDSTPHFEFELDSFNARAQGDELDAAGKLLRYFAHQVPENNVVDPRVMKSLAGCIEAFFEDKKHDYALMLAGLGLVGYVARRRKRT